MKKVLGIHDSAAPHWVGDGFPVRAMISPGRRGTDVDPFLMLDYIGPAEFKPAQHPRGVGEHPHRGFETVTIVYQGELEHRDSTGNGGRIGPGDVQWMTAASGILHEEFHSEPFMRTGGVLHGVQLWVNLPAKDKSAPPGYQTLLKAEIPVVALEGGAGTLRVIAGAYLGHNGPARTFTRLNVWDVALKAEARVTLAIDNGHTATVAVLGGSIGVAAGQTAHESQLVVYERDGDSITLEVSSDASLLVLSGEPINEPVVAHGPFVMNTLGEIKQAMLDYESGKFGSMT